MLTELVRHSTDTMVDLFKEIQNAEFREAFNEFDKVLNFLGCGVVISC